MATMFRQENGHHYPITSVVDNRVTPTESEVDKLYPTGGFQDLGHFAWCLAKCGPRRIEGHQGAIEALRTWGTTQIQVKAPLGLSETTDPDGGALVPPEFAKQIYDRTFAQNQILSILDPVVIRRRTYTLPALKEDSRADGSRHGGILGYWEDEADQHTKTAPKYRQITSRLFKLTVETYITDELLDDSPMGIETYLVPAVAAEINFKINDAVINGKGTGSPLGILNSPSRVTVAAQSSQGANTIIAQNMLDMLGSVSPALKRGMVWFYNPDAEGSLLRFFSGTNEYAASMLVQYFDGQLHICGRPAYLIEQCSPLGTEGDIIAFCPDGYLAVINGELRSAMSLDLSFDYDQSVYKWTFRMNGGPKDLTPLTSFNGSTTTSAIVTLSSTRT